MEKVFAGREVVEDLENVETLVSMLSDDIVNATSVQDKAALVAIGYLYAQDYLLKEARALANEKYLIPV